MLALCPHSGFTGNPVQLLVKLTNLCPGWDDEVHDFIDRGNAQANGSGPVFIQHSLSSPQPTSGTWRTSNGRITKDPRKVYEEEGRAWRILSPCSIRYEHDEPYTTMQWHAPNGYEKYLVLMGGNSDRFDVGSILVDPYYRYGGSRGRFYGRILSVMWDESTHTYLGKDRDYNSFDYFPANAIIDEQVFDTWWDHRSDYIDDPVSKLTSFLIFDGGKEEMIISPNRNEYNYWCSRVYDFPWFNGASGIQPSQFSKAFYATLEDLPRVTGNTFSNLVEAVKLVLDLKEGWNGKFMEHPEQFFQDLWLQYRYVYNTSKSDCEEIISTLDRALSLADAGAIPSYGKAYRDRIQYNCKILIDPSYLFGKDLRTKLRNAGVKLNLANLWDVIPFSFMVDWFTDMASLVSALDGWLETEQIPITECWYSFLSHYDDPRVSAYGRWAGNVPSLPYVEMDTGAGGRTILMRITDVFAIFC